MRVLGNCIPWGWERSGNAAVSSAIRQVGMNHFADLLLPIIASTEGSLITPFARSSVSNINQERSKQHLYLWVGTEGVMKISTLIYFQVLWRVDVLAKVFLSLENSASIEIVCYAEMWNRYADIYWVNIKLFF